MRKILFSIALIASSLAANAQDVLVRKNGDVENVKVLEVTPTEVKYKKASNPDGPTFSETRSSLISVKYANGETQKFSDSPSYNNYNNNVGGGLSGNRAYYAEYGKEKKMTNEISAYLQNGWGIGWQLRREFNPYVALNIVGVSFMSGEYDYFANPDNFGQLNFKFLGVRGYTPSWKWIRGYADLNLGYTLTYEKDSYYHGGYYGYGSYYDDDYDVYHDFGLDFSIGVQLHKRVAIGYNLNFIAPSRYKTHWARISVLF